MNVNHTHSLKLFKTCTACGETKSIERFSPRKDSRDGLRQQCKSCISSGQVRRMNADPKKREAARAYDKIYKTKKRAEYLVWYHELKANPCTDCGIQYPHYQMEYDHRDGATKEFEVSHMVFHLWPKEKVLAEIEKCDLVCVLCHRERTYQRNQLPAEMQGE